MSIYERLRKLDELQKENKRLREELKRAKSAAALVDQIMESVETAKAARTQFEKLYRECLLAKKRMLKAAEKEFEA